MSRWTEYRLPFSPWSNLPRLPCVYCIYFDGCLVYVGQTVSLGARMSDHGFRYGYDGKLKTPWADVPQYVKITIKASFSYKYGDWAMREIRLIKRLQPKYNCHHKNSGAIKCTTTRST